MAQPTRSVKARRILAISLLAVTVALFAWLTVFLTRHFAMFSDDPAAFKAFVESYGWRSWLVALGIQMLQVVVSFIPGEFVEVGMGFAFGHLWGTVLCLLGINLASIPIFCTTRLLGIRAVELFVSREKIDNLKFINSEKRLKTTVFLLYFIPGTPKDLLTYFVGLTRMKLHEFLIITTIARIPSVVSSTVGGALISSGNYWGAVILFAVTGVVSLAGLLIYNRVIDRKNKNATENGGNC